MKKSSVLVLAILFIAISTQPASAQYSFSDDLYYDHPITYELGASLGVMNCFTDLGGKNDVGQKYFKDINLGNSQLAGSVFFTANYRYAIGLRVEGTFGKINANDNSLQNVKPTSYGRYERNLSFKSTIIEMMLAMEIHPRYLIKKYDEHEKLPRFSPYIVGGIGYFAFKPQAMLNGQWIDLHTLHTEGQGFTEYPDRKQYKLKQINFPVGFGVKYKATPLFNVSFECVSRILNTDYLDDVSTEYIDPGVFSRYFSGERLTNALLLNDRQRELDPSHVTNVGWQRGNSNKNDSYFTFNFKMSLIF
ncbi:MAG: DUF6089 family protein [Ferruginibacter sp.]